MHQRNGDKVNAVYIFDVSWQNWNKSNFVNMDTIMIKTKMYILLLFSKIDAICLSLQGKVRPKSNLFNPNTNKKA